MSKYDGFSNSTSGINPLVEGENVIYKLKPKKRAFILNKSLMMFPIALIWLAFDSVFIYNFLSDGEVGNFIWFVIPFFALHLMPVWIWLANVITANRRWKNTTYYITDKRIIIENGFIAGNFQTIYYKDINNVRVSIGVIDKLLGVGDIYISTKLNASNALLDLEEAAEVYPKIQKIIMDIQTDIEYPNAYRPEENPGYNTKLINKQ